MANSYTFDLIGFDAKSNRSKHDSTYTTAEFFLSWVMCIQLFHAIWQTSSAANLFSRIIHALCSITLQ
jgi:hypothetical protein